jgi:hypothetical protein
LFLSPRTIKYHMAEIMNRLHLENRAQVLAYAGKMGLSANNCRKDKKLNSTLSLGTVSFF